MNCEQPPASLAGGSLGPQPHVCAFFNSRDDEYRTLLPFVKEGLDRREKAIHIVDPVLRDEHLARMGGAGIAVDPALASRQLEVLDWNETYLRGGCFDRRGMTARVEDTLIRDRYLTALVVGARQEALEVGVEEALAEDVPAASVYLEVIQAAQYEVGRLWQARRLSVAQEHLATEISRSVMGQLQPHLPFRRTNGKRAVVACVEGELHDLGARMVADFLEMAGFEVAYLGANVPDEHLAQLVRERRPDLVALSATTTSHAPALRRAIGVVRAVEGSRIPIAAGGQLLVRKPDLGRRLGIDIQARDAGTLIAVLERLFGEGSTLQ